ncbi:MAG: hypothetical protein WBD09_07095 [Halobacteriota archaeon]
MEEEKHHEVRKIDTKNIHSIAQHVVDGAISIEAGDMLRLIILRTLPINNNGKIEPVSFPVVELAISKVAAERIKGDIEGWLSKKIKEEKE